MKWQTYSFQMLKGLYKNMQLFEREFLIALYITFYTWVEVYILKCSRLVRHVDWSNSFFVPRSTVDRGVVIDKIIFCLSHKLMICYISTPLSTAEQYNKSNWYLVAASGYLVVASGYLVAASGYLVTWTYMLSDRLTGWGHVIYSGHNKRWRENEYRVASFFVFFKHPYIALSFGLNDLNTFP